MESYKKTNSSSVMADKKTCKNITAPAAISASFLFWLKVKNYRLNQKGGVGQVKSKVTISINTK